MLVLRRERIPLLSPNSVSTHATNGIAQMFMVLPYFYSNILILFFVKFQLISYYLTLLLPVFILQDLCHEYFKSSAKEFLDLMFVYNLFRMESFEFIQGTLYEMFPPACYTEVRKV